MKELVIDLNAIPRIIRRVRGIRKVRKERKRPRPRPLHEEQAGVILSEGETIYSIQPPPLEGQKDVNGVQWMNRPGGKPKAPTNNRGTR